MEATVNTISWAPLSVRLQAWLCRAKDNVRRVESLPNLQIRPRAAVLDSAAWCLCRVRVPW